MTLFPPELDLRFRESAAAEGLLDVSYDVADTPVGPLFVAVTDRGLCRISYDTDPDRELDGLAHTYGSRVLRSARPIDPDARTSRRRPHQEVTPWPESNGQCSVIRRFSIVRTACASSALSDHSR